MPPTWPTRALKVLLPVAMLSLLVQYVAGGSAAAYAPAAGYTPTTDFWAINLHWTFGYVLGVLALVVLILSVISRNRTFIVLSVVGFLGVLAAGIFGMAFVHSTPNAPIDSIAMGIAFLASVFAMGTESGLVMRRGPGPVAGSGSSPSPS